MNDGIFEALGGIGLFLLGMAVMTQGLNSLAGDSLRKILARFTRTPLTGTITGIAITGLLQSSSATTVMAVGFVGAGLMTFTQALGIIFGANIGTTATGWIVALLGFTLSLKMFAFPLLFVGAMFRLLGGKHITALGFAMAGFGAVFIGISLLQHGLESYRDTVTPASFPADTIIGRFLLVLLGIAITLITQSSSAGVAAAITALHVGNITLPQAAAMVIGMDIGTTVTAVIASAGGNIHARRTGWSHVIYNVITGGTAFCVLPFYIHGLTWLAPEIQRSNPEIALVAFHSLFNIIGVIAVLPFTRSFSSLVIRLVPDVQNKLTERLDASLLKSPQVAIESLVITLRDISQAVFASIADMTTIGKVSKDTWRRLDEATLAIQETKDFLTLINDPIAIESGFRRKVSAFHVLDHLTRMIARAKKIEHLSKGLAEPELSAIITQLTSLLRRKLAVSDEIEGTFHALKQLWTDIDLRSDRYRHETIERTVKGKAKVEDLSAQLDAIRWLQRITKHAARITHYLSTDSECTRT